MKSKLLTALEDAFVSAADPALAGPMSAYMKHQFPFYGIKSPLRNSLSKPLIRACRPQNAAELRSILRQLWAKPEREWKYTAILLAESNQKLWTEDFIADFEYMIREQSWWDTVDGISSALIAPYFKMYPTNRYRILSSWEKSENMWLVRVCIIHQLKYRGATDLEYLSGIISRHAHSSEFFIQKAIGWALRQYARTNPDWVRRFVKEHNIKPLSKREALKHISEH